MARALWQGQVIAESDSYETVEGNVYFPPDTVNRALLAPSPTTTRLRLEGHGSLLLRRGRWRAQRGCCVVLPRSEACGREYPGPCRVLAGSHRRVLSQEHRSAASPGFGPEARNRKQETRWLDT